MFLRVNNLCGVLEKKQLSSFRKKSSFSETEFNISLLFVSPKMSLAAVIFRCPLAGRISPINLSTMQMK